MAESDKFQPHFEAEKQPTTVSNPILPTIPGVLRAVRGIRALVALSILAACGQHTPGETVDPNGQYTREVKEEDPKAPEKVGTVGPNRQDTREIKEEDSKAPEKVEPGYSPDRYPTIDSRKEYLLKTYGIIVEGYDKKKSDEFHIKNSREFKSCDLVEGEDQSHFGMAIAKVTTLDSEALHGDEMLLFLDAICQACDSYPKSLFTIKGMEVIVAKDIFTKVNERSVTQSGGYATEGKRMVISFPHMREVLIETFRHEFFHLLDMHHQDFCKDDVIWRSKMNNGKEYRSFKNGFPETNGPIEGHAEVYGAMSEGEDQATIGADLLDPITLKLHMHRAKTDAVLLRKMEAISACKIDLIAGKFVRTMTEDEYRAQTGYDGYQYYYAWSKDMDTKYWNAVLDKSPYRERMRAERPEGAPPRNQYDIIADNLDYERAVRDEIYGDLRLAAEGYGDAHESEIARQLWMKIAEEWEKEGNSSPSYVGDAFHEAGLLEKAKKYYAEAAKESEEEGKLYFAITLYFKAGKEADGERVAEALSRAYEQKRDYNTSMDFWLALEFLQKRQKVPENTKELLKRLAMEDEHKEYFSSAIGTYQAIGDQEKAKEMAYRALEELKPRMRTKRGIDMHMAEVAGKLYENIGENDTAREYFLIAAETKMKAKYFEDAAELYEKAGRIDMAIECLLSRVSLTEKADPGSSYIARIYHQIADLQRKLDSR